MGVHINCIQENEEEEAAGAYCCAATPPWEHPDWGAAMASIMILQHNVVIDPNKKIKK